MKSKTPKWILLVMTLILLIISGCSSSAVTSPEPGDNSAAAVTIGTSPQIMEGRALYESKCAACHGNIDTTDLMTSTTFTDIRSAIVVNMGGMRTLATISDADLQMIADAINNPITQNPLPATPAQTGATPDGTAIYASRCAACHGAIASSNKIGTTVERVQSAIVGNVGRMGSLSAMPALEVQAVVAALNPTTSPSAPLTSASTLSQNQDGASLYSTNCAGCHGTLASTGKSGATSSRIQTAINGNAGNMGYLSTLSATQVSAIASVLATAAPAAPTDGPGLYAANCASCHRTLANSDVREESAGDISEAIRKNKGGMKSLSALTSGMITAIANALKK